MKLDRLFAIFIYLLNRDIVSANRLAKHFEVSQRTINRDMEVLMMAGIPIYSKKGKNGGFGILKNYKINNQLMDYNEIFYTIKSLEGIGQSIDNKKTRNIIEKIKTLLPKSKQDEFSIRNEKMHFDFKYLQNEKDKGKYYKEMEKAVETQNLIEIEYINSKAEKSTRVIEAMSIIFAWSSWYVYSYCRLKKDYRLFRLSRIKNLNRYDELFIRREKRYEEFINESNEYANQDVIDLELIFKKELSYIVEDLFNEGKQEKLDDGSINIKISYPKTEWVYSVILGYGDGVRVIKPVDFKDEIIKRAKKVIENYNI